MRFVCLPEGSGLEPVGMGKQAMAVTTSSAIFSKGTPSAILKWGSTVKEKMTLGKDGQVDFHSGPS